MQIDNADNLISNVKGRILELGGESKAILDISVYPELSWIPDPTRLNFFPTYYFPDTIANLFLRAKENKQYHYFMTKLFTRWTKRAIDFKALDKTFFKKELPPAKIELITKEMVDRKVYSFCYENFVYKDFIVELSPRFNVVGDIIGKMLGFAKQSKAPILMTNQRLVRDVKKLIPILETANIFVDKKQRLWGRFRPILKNTRGVRWLIGITVGTVISPAGIVFAVIDP